MKRSLRTFFSIFWMLLSFHAQGMTLEVQDHQLFATGPVGGDDWLKFKQAFTDPALNTVVLVNSPGGSLWDGLRISKLITDKGYKTVAAGYCNSACAIVFMGGKERRFSNAFAPSWTYIGIHGAHNMDNGAVLTQADPEIYALLKAAMGEKFNTGIVNTALYQMDDRNALLVVPDNIRNPNAPTFHCNSGRTPRKDCTEYKDMGALNLGVITHNDLVTLSLPSAFQLSTKLFGRTQTLPMSDPAAFLETIAQQHCANDRCKESVNHLLSLDDAKALAVRSSGTGIAWSSKQPSILNAVLVAVYGCNHMRNRPAQLCTAETANGYDLRHFYAEAEAEHQAQLAQLQAPTERFYANEEFGGGFGNARTYRTQNPMDIPPLRIDGVQTVGTQELARMLKSDSPPVSIDIGGTDETIPSASNLFFGGNAFEDSKLESAFNSRFTALLKVLSPDPDRPLVILGAGRNWLSVNAALRATQAGYSHVLWYRGGMEAWKAANLPSAPSTVRAVAN
jgi:rhodanese-related sulfurtransferase/ATP-dependent protease ClpP protease subunit